MKIEIKTTAQFIKMAEDIYNNKMWEYLKIVPAHFFFLLRNRKEMNDVIDVAIDMTKKYFYDCLGEHRGNMSFKNANDDKVRQHLRGLSIAYKFIYPQPDVKQRGNKNDHI